MTEYHLAETWEHLDNFIAVNGRVYDLPPHMLLADHEPELRGVLKEIAPEYAEIKFRYDLNHGLAHVVLPEELTTLPEAFTSKEAGILRSIRKQKKADGDVSLACFVLN